MEYPAKMREGVNVRAMLPSTWPRSLGPVSSCPFERGSGIIQACTVTEAGRSRPSMDVVATLT